MSITTEYYICSECLQGSGFITDISTGVFIKSPDQSGFHATHCATRPTKPANGVFLDTGTGYYESGACSFASNGFAGVEPSGGINLYRVFPEPIAVIEHSGVSGCLTTTGKMPLAHLPSGRHWFGYTGFDGGESGFCRQCGERVF